MSALELVGLTGDCDLLLDIGIAAWHFAITTVDDDAVLAAGNADWVLVFTMFAQTYGCLDSFVVFMQRSPLCYCPSSSRVACVHQSAPISIPQS